jgi:hypothetical protein
MRIKTLTLAALMAACTATQKTPDEPKKNTEPEAVTKGDVPVGAMIEAFGAT